MILNASSGCTPLPPPAPRWVAAPAACCPPAVVGGHLTTQNGPKSAPVAGQQRPIGTATTRSTAPPACNGWGHSEGPAHEVGSAHCSPRFGPSATFRRAFAGPYLGARVGQSPRAGGGGGGAAPGAVQSQWRFRGPVHGEPPPVGDFHPSAYGLSLGRVQQVPPPRDGVSVGYGAGRGAPHPSTRAQDCSAPRHTLCSALIPPPRKKIITPGGYYEYG